MRRRFPIAFYNALIKTDIVEKQLPVAFMYEGQVRVGNLNAVRQCANGNKIVNLKIGDEFRSFSLGKIQSSVTIGQCKPKE